MADYKYNLATDKEHVIKLDSYLVYAEWCQPVVYGGQKAGFVVGTSFVGLGAKIKVKGKSEGGKHLGKVSGTVRNNKFIGAFDIPEDIEYGDMIYFEVKLPDNDLEGESNRIPAFPPVTVTNMKWSAKEARRGDILTLSADITGVVSGTEVTVIIYEYDSDNIHDKITELPATVKDNKIEVQWEYEYHEDVDEIPTEEELNRYGKHYNHPEYFFVVQIARQKFGADQESGLLKFKDWIAIEARDILGEPLSNREYTLDFPDGTEKKGKLDDRGYARVEGIPPGQCSITIEPAEEGSDEEDDRA